METTPIEYIALLIEALTLAAKCAVYSQNDEKDFFSDSENNIFIHINYDIASHKVYDPIRFSIRIRDGYENIEIVKNKYKKIKETLKITE